MAKKNKISKKLAKAVRKVIRKEGEEILIGLATGVLTNLMAVAGEKFLHKSKSKKSKK